MKSKMTLSLAQLGRAMKQRRSARLGALACLLTALVAAGLFLGLRDTSAQTGKPDPDYSQVADFTGGRKHLLRNDDLVMTFSFTGAGNDPRNVLFTAGTTDSTPAFLDFSQQLIPSGVAGCPNSGGCYLDVHGLTGQKPVIGRFFNSTKDMTVLLPVQFSTSSKRYLVVMDSKTNGATPPAAGLQFASAQDIADWAGGFNSFLTAAGDFNGDGYDDLLIAASLTTQFPSFPRLFLATATDVNYPSMGFTIKSSAAGYDGSAIREITVGDFNGDQLPDIAYLSVAQNADLSLHTYQVNPNTFDILYGGSVTLYRLANVAVTRALTMTAGKFTPKPNQQLAVGFQIGNQQNSKVQIVDFDAGSIKPNLVTTLDVPDANTDQVLKLKAGRFNWSSPYDQIAWMSSTFPNGTRLEILTVDPVSLNVTKKSDYLVNAWDTGNSASNYIYQGLDIALGNFDRMDPSASNPTQKERSPNLQIAVIGKLWRRVQIFQNPPVINFIGGGLLIANVSEDFSSITEKSRTDPSQGGFFGGNEPYDLSITAGDLQGRSFRLGAPTKITVDHVQPSVVLAAPPMHADYISPGLGKLATVLNFSLAPDGFKSEYEQTESTDAKAKQTGTTSSSFSGEEKISGSYAFGTAGANGEIENGVEVKDSFSAKQDIEDSNDTINGAFNTQEFDVSQETGLSDVVWFKDTSFYLYVYPVIGRRICPADKLDKNGNCADGDKAPMNIMFSAPKSATVQRLASDTLEWYQPPWEYGNLLSYPAGLPQLKQYLPDIDLLTADTSVFATDDAAATLKTTWKNGKTTGQNIDHKELYTEENDFSVEAKAGGEGFGFIGKGSLGLELNFGGSTGKRTLTESETTFSAARGITVTKTGTFPDPFSYKYFFSPYIFGKMKPVGYTDTINSTADLLSFGTLRSAFTVDPIGSTSTSAGAFWAQSDYRKYPDVALNHPNRWAYGAQGKPSNGVIPSNCVAIDNFSMDCVTPTERAPENPWRDPFHDMRGLFITNALNKPSSNALMAPSSQLETATAGDQLKLWTRVYNYSFKAMPAGTKVKVRFYGMLLDDQNLPVNEGGGSFQIGNDVVLSPIAPFDNGPNAPVNWVLAQTTFDTTGRANQALAFWVVVWMEDASGNLVQELPGHGLSGNPTNAAASFNALTALEELVANPLKINPDDPAQVSFSNNIGFYRSAFHILPKTPATATATTPRPLTNVRIEKVEVSGTAIKPARAVEGSVTLRNGAQELLGVMVYFYDGDPAAGGKLVDVERVARLEANRPQKVSINFRPQACGAHTLFVRVDPGEAHATSGQATQTVQVDCPTPVCVAQVCMRSPQYYALNLNRLPQGLVTIIGGGLNKQLSTGDTTKLRLLLQGGASRQQQLNQQFVATQLSLLAQVGVGQTALQSNLLCYKVNFQPVELSNGATLSPAMTLGELLAQVQQAGQSGNAIDQRLLTNLLELLNGDDPQGRCR